MMLENRGNGRRVPALLALAAVRSLGWRCYRRLARTRIITTSPINKPYLAYRVSGTSFRIRVHCGRRGREIYSIGSILSRHILKHIAATAACFAIPRCFQKRQPIPAY